MKTVFPWRTFCLTAAFASLAPAAAIDYVRVSSTIAGGVGGGGNALTYSSLTGLTSSGSALPPSTIDQSQSPNTNLLAQTAAWVAVEGVLVNGSQTYLTGAYASADLSTGQLGVLGTSGKISGPGVPVNGLGRGSATMRDEVTFSNTTGLAIPIDVFYTLSGSIRAGADGSIGETMVLCLGVSCRLAGNTLIGPSFRYMFFRNSAFLPDGHYINDPTSGWLSTSFLPGNDPTAGVFHGQYLVPAGSSTVDFFASLTIDCRFDAACDFSHTGTFSLNLPSGVTLSSASGVLLSAPAPSAAPEPGSIVMLGLGVALIAGIAKRHGLGLQ